MKDYVRIEKREGQRTNISTSFFSFYVYHCVKYHIVLHLKSHVDKHKNQRVLQKMPFQRHNLITRPFLESSVASLLLCLYRRQHVNNKKKNNTAIQCVPPLIQAHKNNGDEEKGRIIHGILLATPSGIYQPYTITSPLHLSSIQMMLSY
jgi:hypothetical protein